MQRLYRSRDHKMLAGIFGWLGETYKIDPTLLRLGYAALTILSAGGPGIILYIIGWAIIPEEPVIPPSAITPPPDTEVQ